MYGVRWWQADGTDWEMADQIQLTGARGSWLPGWNDAVCLAAPISGPARHKPSDVPETACGCGYWGYWLLDAAPVPGLDHPPVVGVIEGAGAALIGDKGFRCARARIVALHVPYPGAVGVPGYRPDGDDDQWRNLLESALSARYGVPVYATFPAMLAMHPTTVSYLPGDSLVPAYLRDLPVLAAEDKYTCPSCSQVVSRQGTQAPRHRCGGSLPYAGRGASQQQVLAYAARSGLYAALRPGPAPAGPSAGWVPVPPAGQAEPRLAGPPEPRRPRPAVTPLDAIAVLQARKEQWGPDQ